MKISLVIHSYNWGSANNNAETKKKFEKKNEN